MTERRCINKCVSYKNPGSNYAGTPRCQKQIRRFQLKYCKRCKVYFDIEDKYCLCCLAQLRVHARNKRNSTIKNLLVKTI